MASIFCDCRRSASVRASARSALRRCSTLRVSAPMTTIWPTMKSEPAQISAWFSP